MTPALVVVALAALGLGALLYGLPYALRRRAERRLAARCAAERLLVLSYDDGPGPLLTPRLLALLEAHGARATFFPLGVRAREHPELLAETARRGHEIGCHSERHEHALRVGPLGAWRDAHRGLETLRPWLGKPPLFRPPFGKVDLATASLLATSGVRLAWWTIDSGDTDGAEDPGEVERKLLAAGGAVVLFHDFDGRPQRSDYVLAATERLLDAAHRNGFRVVLLGTLL